MLKLRESSGLALAMSTLLFFVLIKFSIIQSNIGLTFVVSAAIAIALFFFSSPSNGIETPKANQLVIRGISGLFIIYVAIGPWTLPSGSSNYSPLLIIVVNLICLLFLTLSFRREGYIVPGLLLLICQKNLVSIATNLPISSTDYMPLVEFGILLGSAPLVMTILRAAFQKSALIANIKVENQHWLFFIAISAHSANYFFSGVMKLAISDPAWSWVTNNPTLSLMLAAHETGSLPLSIMGSHAVSIIYSLTESNIVLINALTLLIQLSPLIILRKTKWLIVAIILFDLTHVVIFLLTGIFFYKWIVLNALIVAALWKLRDFQITFHGYLGLLLCMLVSPALFFVAFLGWHDTPSFNDEYFVAHINSAETFRVPSNYFLASSVTHAQGRLSWAKPGHFETGASGVLYKVLQSDQRWQDAMDCKLPSNTTEEKINFFNIRDRIIQHHNFVLTKLDENGRFSYDLYPHHIWSMPWSYNSFYQLDKRLIVGYTYVIESKCLSPSFGATEQSNIIRRTDKYFDVR